MRKCRVRNAGFAVLRIMLVMLFVVWAPFTWAQEAPAPPTQAAAAGTPPPKVDTGDTAWVLAASALVMAMTMPGLALFYGGLVRSKNVLGTITHSFIILCLVSLVWVLWGYSLAFGPDVGGFIGNLNWFGLSQVGSDPSTYAATIPHQVFMLFQLMFAAITPALVTGAFAERMRFSSLLLFSALWVTLIYCPLAHWIWGGGWLNKMGAMDFAGGAVVHISSGWAALACALVLGRRQGYGTAQLVPHNLPMTLLGAGLLWFGWFGFNAGSALGASALAASAFLATHTAAAAGAMSWMMAEWLHRGKPTSLGVASGAIAGLATVTPAAGFVGLFAALCIGLAAGAACYGAVVWKGRLGYDDSLDVVGIHGVGGILGILATGLFASKAINSAGADGLFFGNPGQFGIQLLTAGVSVIFAFVGTFFILKVVDGMVGLRITADDEQRGLDLSQHEERAYSND
jgi:Amt family ammonium transporter